MSTTPLSLTLNNRIRQCGLGIFRDLEEQQVSPLEIRYWNARLMAWSMAYPEFKVSLFRLVDVLPTLRTKEAIVDHVQQYLTAPASSIHPSLGWLIGLSANRIAGSLCAFLVRRGVEQMARLFIAGKDAHSALPMLQRLRRNGYAFTVDLLGEFCVSEDEANRYLNRYLEALDVLAASFQGTTAGGPLIANHPGEQSPICISVKLSALYSQTGALNAARSVEVLSERLSVIARRAKAYGALLYVDAEDSGTNTIIYETFTRVFSSPEFIDFPYPGIVIQAYSKGAEARVQDMLEFSRRRQAPIAVRLVKGAYWDYERVVSAQNDWEFPLWSDKRSSDSCFEHLSRVLLRNRELCLPAFGSHNIRSLAHACCYAESEGLSPNDFEIQVLYGMAEPIAEAFSRRGYLTRMYVPLGELLPGMGYLVRRLLENTSNESFLRHTFFDMTEAIQLLEDPAMNRGADSSMAEEAIHLEPIVPTAHEGVALKLDY